MRLARALFPALVLVAATATAQLDPLSGAPPAGPLVTAEGLVTSRSGDDVQGVITAKIADGWHINSNTPNDEYLIGTTITLTTADLVGAPRFPPHTLRSFSFSGDKQIAVFEGTIRIPFAAKLKPGATEVRGTVNYQACSDRVCLPPKKADFAISATPAAGATSAAPSGAFTPLTAAPKGAQPKASLFGSDIGATFTSRGLPLTLFAIFILGLALNLTPCVYPLIPITIGYFSSQSGGSRGQRVALSSLYVIGIAITYSALGVFSALSGRLFGAWLQLPAVLVFFALLMLVMASSMFGAFEIRVPHFITDRSGGRAGMAGALTMGLLIGIVAAPCVGPFVISLIALVSSLQSPFLGFLMFFVLALGLGVPYLLLGIFSSGLSAIPRSGMWMVQVKKAMGFILIAMAFYFLRPILGEDVFRWGVALSLLTGAIFLFVTRTPGARVLRIAMAVLLLVSGVAFALPRNHGTGVTWDKYDAKALADARAAGKPVVIDFYADWCLPCKELDEKTFAEPKVKDELGRFVRVKADLTSPEDPTTQALTKQYGIVGVPTLVFIDAKGEEQKELRLTGYEPPAKFAERAGKVR
ncbi:MAG TPA: cytochrome c biogenesis protein CcdA [Thermoanaerobaculia bacterium]|nr:cytochrome c biogenesis protein CcdA [Thermoanaerobaculia bacterium]